MTNKLTAAIGQSLLAMGLYNVSFESMVLSFRGKMYAHLQTHDVNSLQKFMEACNSADNTFKFCTPKLIELGVIDKEDVNSIREMRKRRNKFAHEGYNEITTVTVADVEEDVWLMNRITHKVQNWKSSDSSAPAVGEVISLKISPAIFSLYLSVANDIATSLLPLERPNSTP